MSGLDERYHTALETLTSRLDDVSILDDGSIPWALTGSTSFALQSVPISPNDIDVQTTKEGAYVIEKAFADQIIDPVSFSESEMIRSHFGVFELNEIRVELMGAIQKRQPDGAWDRPVDITDHRVFVDLEDISIPVLTLQYEATAYEQLGRSDRATLLAKYADD